MRAVIDSISRSVPGGLTELITLGRALKKRAADVVAYFDLRDQQRADRGDQRQARAPPRVRARVRNLTTYIARSLLETGGFIPQPHPGP